MEPSRRHTGNEASPHRVSHTTNRQLREREAGLTSAWATGLMSHTLMGTLPGGHWRLCFTDGEPRVLTPGHVVNLAESGQALVGKAKPCPGQCEPPSPPASPQGGPGGPGWGVDKEAWHREGEGRWGRGQGAETSVGVGCGL